MLGEPLTNKELFDGPLGAVLTNHVVSRVASRLDPSHEGYVPYPDFDDTNRDPLNGYNVAYDLFGALDTTYPQALQLRDGYGLGKICTQEYKSGVYPMHHGFAEIGFFAVASSGIAREVYGFLTENGLAVDQEVNLPLYDEARMAKTMWFGRIVNTLALTAGPANTSIFRSPKKYYNELMMGNDPSEVIFGIPRASLFAVRESDDGVIVEIPKSSLESLLVQKREQGFNGCPVARSSFSMQSDHYEQINASGQLDEPRICMNDGDHTRVAYIQPRQTAIHTAVSAWGKYLEGYCGYLVAEQGFAHDTVYASNIDERVLLTTV